LSISEERKVTRYRCVVFQSTGNFIPYSGISFEYASNAMRQYEHDMSVEVQRNQGDGWETIMGVMR
jgi:hypothetical protein